MFRRRRLFADPANTPISGNEFRWRAAALLRRLGETDEGQALAAVVEYGRRNVEEQRRLR